MVLSFAGSSESRSRNLEPLIRSNACLSEVVKDECEGSEQAQYLDDRKPGVDSRVTAKIFASQHLFGHDYVQDQTLPKSW